MCTVKRNPGKADRRVGNGQGAEVLPIATVLPRVACGVVTGKREPRKSAAKYVQHKGVGLDAAPSQLPP